MYRNLLLYTVAHAWYIYLQAGKTLIQVKENQSKNQIKKELGHH